MKITKFVHSCVLIEKDDKAILIDPGMFSWKSGLVNVSKLPKLDAIVVTHLHSDHLGEPFVQTLVAAQPEAQWVAPADAHTKLQELGVTKVTDQSIDHVEVQTIEHAKVVPFGVSCQDLIVHCFGLVTHPGDTHDITETKDILCLPVQAPWGTTVRAMELGQELKPKYILPIHDWMWNSDWQNMVYDRFETVFTDSNTTFIRTQDGRSVEIET